MGAARVIFPSSPTECRPKRQWPACTLAIFLAWAAPATAHLPELYGREYRRADPDTLQGPQMAEQPRILRPASKEEREHESRLRRLEVAEGPYSQGLADPLVNLAHYQLERGDAGDAIASLRRAIHLIRINDGLDSHSQLPLLRRLIALYRSEGAYAHLGDAYSYYYRVSGVGRQAFTDDQLDSALEYLDWERELYASRHDGAQRSHLLRAYEANRDMLQTAEDADREVYVPLAMSQLRNLYLILGDRPLELAMPEAPNRDKKLATIQRLAYSKGLELLQQCIDRSDEASPRQLAKIRLELGDWQQWNGKLRSAREQYAKVVELMEHAGDEELLAQWFDTPVELPDEKDLWRVIHEEEEDALHVIEASYEVNSLGESRRVKVAVDEEGGEGEAGKIRAMLRDTHFRPRIGKDGPESGPRVTRYYQLVGN